MKNTNSNKKELSPEQREELLRALKARFEKNMNRHKGLEWAKVQAKLEANAKKLWSLNEMERTGGEPDVPALPCSYREFHPGLNASNAGSPKVLPETPTRSTQPNRRRAGARALSRCV